MQETLTVNGPKILSLLKPDTYVYDVIHDFKRMKRVFQFSI